MQRDVAFVSTVEPAVDTLFHPAVSAWLHGRFGQPTEVQRRAWAATTRRRHALIAAPTGSGKTLAAFLAAIDELVVQGLSQPLPDAVQVLYVSPLKALSNDIRHNLEEPLAGIQANLRALGLPELGIRAATRTGDTPSAERERMRRRPPHILVTTPESLYILLSSESGRAMLKSVRSVIVDELHAVAGGKRGAHLMLSLERLAALTVDAGAPCEPVRIGLSATVRPLDEMARFLVGRRGEGDDEVVVIDAGHVRERDIALELPRSPLGPVMAMEVWDELYDRLADLSHTHRTTLVFVNQRRTAERMARHLAERLGEEHVTAHHGSLSREHRQRAEQRLKAGELKVLVATSSLELGIDIGDIDLVCQIGSPRSINAFLQRVGRAGHAIGAVPKGRLFPLSLDDLLECTALLDAVARGELDRIRVPRQPLDALAQQIVAETACRDWALSALYERCRRAWPYRDLELREFEQVVEMLDEGYGTRRGRRGAWLHYDAVHRMLRGRRGARMGAITNAGVIPDQFDYEVVLLPEEHRVGTLHEDFAFESLPGDIFQLGNMSYRIAKVETGKVLVEDARGQPPSMPFWFGEGLGRTDELSHAVARLCEALEARLDGGVEACAEWLRAALGLPASAADQLARYLGAARAALGVLPSERQIVFERFFDEVGDMHLVIHSPHGSRINKAWGLALRKRFCRQFNFELQASALDDSIVLSLGPTHSFALEEVRHYLKSATARDVLVQALLDAPMFATRWRWNASAALAVLRRRGGRKVPPQFQRSDSEDLLTVVFPDQVACAENLVGEREIPDHPLVAQTLEDCLHETLDVDGFVRLLAAMESGAVRVACRDLTTPSPLAQAILNARPNAFLDDGAAEERRTRAVRSRMPLDLQEATRSGRLDARAIAQVLEQIRPEIRDAEELHDALRVHGFLTREEAPFAEFAAALGEQRRATRLRTGTGADLQVAAERLHEFQAVFPRAGLTPVIAAVGAERPDAEEALKEILRGRLELLGPVSAATLAAPLGVGADTVRGALLGLEAEGAVLRGCFTGEPVEADEWCDRRLLARMHRQTREHRRADSQPVPPARFMRFLFSWHRLAPLTSEPGADERWDGEAGLVAALGQLEGFVAPAAAWEEELLRARLKDYAPAMLDPLCAAGRIAWWRPRAPGEASGRKTGPVRGTPLMLCAREALPHWQAADAESNLDEIDLSTRAQKVLDALRAHGASFFDELRSDAGLLDIEAEQALAELVAQGLVSCDSFAGLRVLILPTDQRRRQQRRPGRAPGLQDAGRWALTRRPRQVCEPPVEHIARALLRRYGVVFRKLLEREDGLPPWRDLHQVYRRLEARDEVRGGRFVNGFSGEQFALPEAAAALRKSPPPGREWVRVSALDPLNLAGILTPGDKVARLPGHRILFEDGVPLAVRAAGEVHRLRAVDESAGWEIRQALLRD